MERIIKKSWFPVADISAAGKWYWVVLAGGFYLFLTVRSLIQDYTTPLEVAVAGRVPFTYLKLHHVVFRETVFHLMALAGAWGIVSVLRLSNEELGWERAQSFKSIIFASAAGLVCWGVVTVATMHLLAGKVFFFWPAHVKFGLIGLFSLADVYGIFPYVNSFAIAPVVEEFLFRGVFFALFARKFGATRAILFSSLLDILLHYDLTGLLFSRTWGYADTQALFYLPRFLQLAVFSCLAGWLRSRRFPLPALVLFHAVYNVLASSISWTLV